MTPADFDTLRAKAPTCMEESKLARRNKELLSEIDRLTILNTSSVEELQQVKMKLRDVELNLDLKYEKCEDKKSEVLVLEKENQELKNINAELIESLSASKRDTEGAIKSKSEIIMKLNNELCEMKEKNSLEISSIRKDFRS